MKIAGLTGGIGSGKSTVARLLTARGACVIDADEVARAVVAPDLPAWRDIVARFGEKVLRPDRTIDREALAGEVFGRPDRLEVLNRITHPRIGEEIAARLRRCEREGAPLAVIDAALLLESPATSWLKPVIVVVADETVRLRRVVERDGASEEAALRRIRSQWTDARRAACADHIIDNTGSLADLEPQVENVFRKIMSEPAAPGVVKK